MNDDLLDTSAPETPPSPKRKRRGIGIAAIVGGVAAAGLIVTGIAVSGNNEPADAEDVPAATAPAVTGPDAPDVARPELTTSQEQAKIGAATYLQITAFSRTGLIAQLEYEGFSTADATFGVDAAKANWNSQAAKAAQNYLDTMSFSRSGLIDQLIHDGFTPEQAAHGADVVGL